MRAAVRVAVVVVVALVASARAAAAYDAEETFRQGRVVVSPEVGGGWQFHFEKRSDRSELEMVNGGVRVGIVPVGVMGSGPLRGALELGLEPFYQRYTGTTSAFFAGLAGVGRYHFVALGRFVPYVELAAAAGGTDLRIREIDSTFTFLLFAGAGASVFVTDRTAMYAGYRLQHVSNGNTASPNRGFESHTAVVGVSFFLD